MSEETKSKVLPDDPEVRRAFWTDVLWKLAESSRMKKFIDDNFTIGVALDDETKTVTTSVVEKPVSVGPALSGAQIFRIHNECLLHGAKDASKLVDKILKTLGQEGSSLILPEDPIHGLDQLQTDLKTKLDG